MPDGAIKGLLIEIQHWHPASQRISDAGEFTLPRVEARSTLTSSEVKCRSGAEYQGFGPTLASEYLASTHGITASRETVRKWMTEAGRAPQ
jgi:hypothetical protein